MPHSQSLTIHDHIDRGDHIHVYRASSSDTLAYIEVAEGGRTATARLTRRQAHELHAYLGELLGLGIPTPKAPLTASVPHRGGTKASRNLDRPAHGGYPGHRFDVV